MATQESLGDEIVPDGVVVSNGEGIVSGTMTGPAVPDSATPTTTTDDSSDDEDELKFPWERPTKAGILGKAVNQSVLF